MLLAIIWREEEFENKHECETEHRNENMGLTYSPDTSVLAKAESLRGVAPCLSAAMSHSTLLRPRWM